MQQKTMKYQKINLSEFTLFLSVMQNREAYENVLSIILNEQDLALEEVKVERVVLNEKGKKAIRLDAWARDSKDRQINTEILVKDTRIERLDEIVTEVKESEEWEDVHMSIYSEAMEEGLIRGRQESILELLEDYGPVGADLQQKIMDETNVEILRKFCKLASRVNSVEEFEAQFNN